MNSSIDRPRNTNSPTDTEKNIEFLRNRNEHVDYSRIKSSFFKEKKINTEKATESQFLALGSFRVDLPRRRCKR